MVTRLKKEPMYINKSCNKKYKCTSLLKKNSFQFNQIMTDKKKYE